MTKYFKAEQQLAKDRRVREQRAYRDYLFTQMNERKARDHHKQWQDKVYIENRYSASNLVLPYTMLQKLSKCEVKARLCWNLMIIPLLWFYVKSNFSEFKLSKNVIYGNYRDVEFCFSVNLSNFQVPNLCTEIQSSASLK